jgi:hypothetical protein
VLLAVIAAGVIGVIVNGSWWETVITAAPLDLLLVPDSRGYVWG